MTNCDLSEGRADRASLEQLCEMVKSYSTPYEDLAEFIEDKAFAECDADRYLGAVAQLIGLAEFFEQMENKNEENSRDLVDVYILIGEIHQCHDNFEDSVEWFKKAVVVDDRAAEPYHSLAVSYAQLRDLPSAVRCLEQELALSPGNYYTYLQLADYYDALGNEDRSEDTITRLLRRDPDNIQALHRVIVRYETTEPGVEVELLRRRIVSQRDGLTKLGMIIWTYHMFRERRFDEALQFLSSREDEGKDLSIVNILKAHIYGEMGLVTKKRTELATFRKKNNGKQAFMANKLKEFGDVFGDAAVSRLMKRLVISHPAPGDSGLFPARSA